VWQFLPKIFTAAQTNDNRHQTGVQVLEILDKEVPEEA
jgi:hypothetical protein